MASVSKQPYVSEGEKSLVMPHGGRNIEDYIYNEQALQAIVIPYDKEHQKELSEILNNSHFRDGCIIVDSSREGILKDPIIEEANSYANVNNCSLIKIDSFEGGLLGECILDSFRSFPSLRVTLGSFNNFLEKALTHIKGDEYHPACSSNHLIIVPYNSPRVKYSNLLEKNNFSVFYSCEPESSCRC